MAFLINRSHMSLPHPKCVPTQNIETKKSIKEMALLALHLKATHNATMELGKKINCDKICQASLE